jgi:hypothetical protein
MRSEEQERAPARLEVSRVDDGHFVVRERAIA